MSFIAKLSINNDGARDTRIITIKAENKNAAIKQINADGETTRILWIKTV